MWYVEKMKEMTTVDRPAPANVTFTLASVEKHLESKRSSLTFKQGADSGKCTHRPLTGVLANRELHEDKRNATHHQHDQIRDHKCSWIKETAFTRL